MYDVFYPVCVRYQFFFRSSFFVRLYSRVVIASLSPFSVSDWCVCVCWDWKSFAISYMHTDTHILTQCHLHSGWFSTLCKQFWHTTNFYYHSENENETRNTGALAVVYMEQVFGTKTAPKKVNICVITLFEYAKESLFQLNEKCRSLLEWYTW